MFRNLYRHFQYFLDRAFAHGMAARLGILLSISLVIVFVGSLAPFLGLFGPENDHVATIDRGYGEGMLDAFWWSLKHAVDPGTFTADYGSSVKITLFAFFITICGMAVFATFIGLIAASITERLQILDQGIGDVIENGHALILGWNARAPAVISRLVEDTKKGRVVVLAKGDIANMRNQLRVMEKMSSKVLRRVIFRQGIPTSEINLNRVSYAKAGRIIIMASDGGANDLSAYDIDAVELISLFTNTQIWEGKPPHIVAEIQDPGSQEVANIAGDYQIPIVTSADMISRILVQCSRQPDLSAVYLELFSGGKNKLVLEKVPACAGLTFGEILNRFPGATPIGVCDVLEHDDREIHIPDLNPPANHVIEEQEKIILISSKPNVVFDKVETTLTALPDRAEDGFKLRALENILILGWNKSIYNMLGQYDDYMEDGCGVVKIVSALPPDEARQLLDENLSKPLTHITVDIEQANFLKRHKMKELVTNAVDSVVILSTEEHIASDPDSRIKMALILIHSLFETQKFARKPHVVAEILENTGTFSRMPFSQFELVTSPEIISLMLTHLAIENDLRTVTTELLNPSGQEVYLKPAQSYVELGSEFYYEQLVVVGKSKEDIIWGIVWSETSRPGKSLQERIEINPDRSQTMILHDGDKIIVLSGGLYS